MRDQPKGMIRELKQGYEIPDSTSIRSFSAGIGTKATLGRFKWKKCGKQKISVKYFI